MQHTKGSPTRYKKERKYRRFDLQFPVSLSFPSGKAAHDLGAVSKNVSLGGMLVQAGGQIPLHTQVNLTMKVVGLSSRRPIRLRGEGEIVRVEPLDPGAGFAIAVECKQPIVEMEDHLSAAG
ncbi:MAG TPA: PilZ domain-containing protein [Candidatus Dormibacteraeota bacterium]|nr:PilZ domain-containing protein [Candidatus Dormibacteraeota bacterium]